MLIMSTLHNMGPSQSSPATVSLFSPSPLLSFHSILPHLFSLFSDKPPRPLPLLTTGLTGAARSTAVFIKNQEEPHPSQTSTAGQHVTSPTSSGKSWRFIFYLYARSIFHMGNSDWMKSSSKWFASQFSPEWRKESENNRLDGGISASFPAIWWIGWKTLSWRFRRENGDSVAPCHILFWKLSVSHIVK